MTIQRDWPNNQARARDLCAELANDSYLALKPVIEGRASGPAELRCVAAAAMNLQQISRILEGCGARSDPLSVDALNTRSILKTIS